MRLSGDCVNFDTMLAGSPFSVVYVFTLHDGLDTVSDMLIARRLIAKSILFIGHVIVRKFSSVKFVLRTRTKGKGLVVFVRSSSDGNGARLCLTSAKVAIFSERCKFHKNFIQLY